MTSKNNINSMMTGHGLVMVCKLIKACHVEGVKMSRFRAYMKVLFKVAFKLEVTSR